MINWNQELPQENLTQKDIMQFLLHSSQHAATREELENARANLTQDISKLDDKIAKLETNLRQEITKLDDKISKLDDKIAKLDDKVSKVETNLRQEISKVDTKFDRLQWLIIATILTVLLKDQILALLT